MRDSFVLDAASPLMQITCTIPVVVPHFGEVSGLVLSNLEA
jgi:hypothetical protein